MTGAILSAQHITRRYAGFVALNDVSLEVAKGEICGLIGPNGAGKTTLMDVICGRGGGRSSGTVTLMGRRIDGLDARRRRKAGLGRSFQKTNIFPDLTIEEQMMLAARATGAANALEVMQELQIAALADRRAGDVSYGDQRRVDIALALMGRPPVVLLDEPAAGLSISKSLALSILLKDLARRWGVTVMIVEHDMDVIFSICDRIIVLQLGKILTAGTADEIRRNPDVVRAYLGSAAT